jgi:hypothetical protein
MVAMIKCYVPLSIFVGSGTILLIGHPSLAVLASRAMLNTPLIIMACFLLTVAEVRKAGNFLEYRRLFRWKAVSYDQIAQCKRSWLLGLGHMTVHRSEMHRSRIFFVTSTVDNSDTSDLTAYINGRSGGRLERKLKSKDNLDRADYNSRRFCLVMGSVGVLFSIAASLLFPQFLAEPRADLFPSAVTLGGRFLWRATTWPWALVTCTILMAQILRLHFKEKAWAAALAVGVFLGHMAVQALR